MFSQMKDTKHIRWDFHSVAWVMAHGSDFGGLGCLGGQNIFFQTWSCGIANQRGWRAEQNASKIFILGSNWWPWGEVKWSNIIKFQLPCQFQRFLYQTLCVFSQMKDTKHIRWDFHSVAWVGLWSKFFFSNMVMWHIQSTGMPSRTECK